MNALRARFDILTAQSPSFDRRALSQAWYSALHLASQKGFAGREPPARCARGRSAFASVQKPAHPLFALANPGSAKSWKPLAQRARRLAPALPIAGDARPHSERRAEPSPLAKTIVEKIISNSAATRFVIESPRGRVIIHVLRRDDRVHLAAICGGGVRGEVEKALAQARFALAGMGVAVR